MTKPHCIEKRIFPRFPILLAPLVLSCAFAGNASAQDAPAPAAPVEAARAGDNSENNTPETDDVETDAAPGNPKAGVDEDAEVDGPEAAMPENKAAGPAAQVISGVTEAQAAEGTRNKAASTNAQMAGRQPASVLQSERIKPRAFGGAPSRNDLANRARSRQKRLESIVRGVMSQAGFTDLPMQGYIAAHMANEDQARGPLRKKGEQLFLALKSVRVTNVQIDELLREFQKALDDDRLRRLQCEANLDAKIGYSKNARLQAVLVLFGIIGDGALFVPLREPPRPRQTVPVQSNKPVQRQETEALPVSAAATTASANGAEVSQTAAPQAAGAATAHRTDTSTVDSANAKPANYDSGPSPAESKDRASFK